MQRCRHCEYVLSLIVLPPAESLPTPMAIGFASPRSDETSHGKATPAATHSWLVRTVACMRSDDLSGPPTPTSRCSFEMAQFAAASLARSWALALAADASGLPRPLLRRRLAVGMDGEGGNTGGDCCTTAVVPAPAPAPAPVLTPLFAAGAGVASAMVSPVPLRAGENAPPPVFPTRTTAPAVAAVAAVEASAPAPDRLPSVPRMESSARGWCTSVAGRVTSPSPAAESPAEPPRLNAVNEMSGSPMSGISGSDDVADSGDGL